MHVSNMQKNHEYVHQIKYLAERKKKKKLAGYIFIRYTKG